MEEKMRTGRIMIESLLFGMILGTASITNSFALVYPAVLTAGLLFLEAIDMKEKRARK